MSRSGIRAILTMAVLVALTVPWAASAAPNHTARVEPTAWFSAVKGWLANLWAEAGCIADASGRCLPTSPTTDNGCVAIPDGRCLGARLEARPPVDATTDNGCIADPDGRCQAGQ